MSIQQQNPLIPAILTVLRQQALNPAAKPFGIHHLLSCLAQHPCLADLDESCELALFKKNFLLMNGLYQLQRSLWEEETLVLNIETLNLRLFCAGEQRSGNALPDAADPMREYYLDWHHFHETTQKDVAALLQSFWSHLDQGSARVEALQVLGLNETATESEIKIGYQRLAQQYHPDRGGDAARFMEIRAAYEILRK